MRRETHLPIVYVNQVGGQDDLVFDGGSMVVDADGELVHRCAQFRAGVEVVDISAGGTVAPELDIDEEVWEALVLGTHDYVTKNGFTDVVIGVSGGVDSSLVATIAVDALGSDHVHGVLMPSRYSSDHSVTDAEKLCANLGIEHRTIAIEPAHRAFLEMLAPSFEGVEPDVTEENLQSRLRGVTAMALSNKFGWLVLTTGNKSESAVGYSTLYGDTAGGLAVIKDVYKLRVYELCRWRNDRAGRELIPETVLTKPPSAELRPDQRDDQSLPPYEVLDPLARGVHRRRPDRGRAHRDRVRGGGGPADLPAGRPRGVQASAEPPGPPGDGEGVRSRPTAADHQPLPLRPVG